MKLKTRLRITFASIILIPLLMSVIAFTIIALSTGSLGGVAPPPVHDEGTMSVIALSTFADDEMSLIWIGEL